MEETPGRATERSLSQDGQTCSDKGRLLHHLGLTVSRPTNSTWITIFQLAPVYHLFHSFKMSHWCWNVWRNYDQFFCFLFKKKVSGSQKQMCVPEIQWPLEVRSTSITGSLWPAYLTLLPWTPVSAANILFTLKVDFKLFPSLITLPDVSLKKNIIILEVWCTTTDY